MEICIHSKNQLLVCWLDWQVAKRTGCTGTAGSVATGDQVIGGRGAKRTGAKVAGHVARIFHAQMSSCLGIEGATGAPTGSDCRVMLVEMVDQQGGGVTKLVVLVHHCRTGGAVEPEVGGCKRIGC